MQAAELIEDHESRVKEMVALAAGGRRDENPGERKMREAWEANQRACGLSEPEPELKSLAEYATHERRLQALEGWKGERENWEYKHSVRLQKLETTAQSTRGHVADMERVDKRFANVDANHSDSVHRLHKLDVRLGSVEKDRYEYATLTARVHDLERWQHTGEQPASVNVENENQRAHNELNATVKKRAAQLDSCAAQLANMAENDRAQETRLRNIEAHTQAMSELLQRHERELALSRACMNVKPQDLSKLENPLNVQGQMQERANAYSLEMLRHGAGISLDREG